MLTRCPGCGEQIDEELDVCPHCKRDFTIAVKGTGRRIGSLDNSPIKGEPPTASEPKPPPKPAPKPPPKPPPKPAPSPAAKADPREKNPPPPADPRAKKNDPPAGSAPAADSLDDLPPHMRAELETPPRGDNLDDLPPHMRAELETPPRGDSLDDLPPHMRAEVEAPPKSNEFDDSALPPHMRGEAMGSFTPRPLAEKPGNPLMYIVIAVVFVGGFIFSRVTMKKEAPAPVVAEKTAEPEEAVKDPGSTESGDAVKTDSEEEAAAKAKALENSSISFADAPEPPKIEDSETPPSDAPPSARKTRRPKGAGRPAAISEGENPGSSPPPPSHAKWKFRATVVNMITLKPVADCEVALYNNDTNERFPTATGEDGGFRKTVPASSSGYKILFRHNEYEPKFLPGSAHPFRSMSEDERKEVGKKLKQFTEQIDPIRADDKGEVQQTFFLLPREKHGMSLEDALDR